MPFITGINQQIHLQTIIPVWIASPMPEEEKLDFKMMWA
jgi:hypothetical protein